MAKFLGYYCGNFPNEDGLLQEMVEAWGGTFEKLNNAQRLWMLRALAVNLFEKDPNSEADSEHDEEIEEVIERFDEIPEGFSRDTCKTGRVVNFCCRAYFIDLPTCP